MHNILLSKFTQMVDEEWNPLMSYLFGRKIFFEKNLCIFFVFDAIENDGQQKSFTI
jgi:hypothetical protein